MAETICNTSPLQYLHQLGALHILNEILTRNQRNFTVLVEDPLEQLRQLQQQIDEYIHRLEATGTSATT